MKSSRAESGITAADFHYQRLLHYSNAGKGRRLWVRDATLRYSWQVANFTDYNCLLLDWLARVSLNSTRVAQERDEYLSRIVMAMVRGLGELARTEGRRVADYAELCARLKPLGRAKGDGFDRIWSDFFTSGWASTYPTAYRSAGMLIHYHFNQGSQFAGAMEKLQGARVGISPQEAEAWGAGMMRRWVNVNDVERLACVVWTDRQVGAHPYTHWSSLKDKGCNCSTCTGQGGWRNPSGG